MLRDQAREHRRLVPVSFLLAKKHETVRAVVGRAFQLHQRAGGIGGFEDRQAAGSRYAEVRQALFANAYYLTWGAPGEPPLPVYDVTLCRTLKGLLPFGTGWR